jgi:arabinofuranosyltransferase
LTAPQPTASRPQKPALPSDALRRTLLVALAAAGFVLVCWQFWHIRRDDAYIVYQYARNLASGHGFAFNAGERVLGVTTPLFTLLLAALYPAAGGCIAEVSLVLGAASIVAQALLLYLLLRGHLPGSALALFGFVLLNFGASAQFLTQETNTFAALVLAVLWALESRRGNLCGLLLGLAFLCRYDAALLVPAVAVRAWSLDRRLLLRVLGCSLLVVLPWLLFAQLYFGSVLPHTARSKYGITPFWDYVTHYAWHFAMRPWAPFGAASNSLPLLLLSGALWISGLRLILRKLPQLLPLVAFSAALWLVYAAIGPRRYQHWHLYVTLLTSNVVLFLGLAGPLERWLVSRPGSAGRLLAWFAALAYAGLLVAAIPSDLRSPAYASWLGGRHRKYTTIARWVSAHVRPGQSFMAREFGTLGYLTGLRMIDPNGLINWTNDFPRHDRTQSMLPLIERYQPDAILVNSLREARYLEQRAGYRLVHVFALEGALAPLLIRSPEVLRDPARLE